MDGAEFLIGMDELGFVESAIHPGDTTNLMPVDCTGKQLTLYANGNKLVEVQDSEFSSGDIGLVANTYDAPGTDILFDNLVVQKPQPFSHAVYL